MFSGVTVFDQNKLTSIHVYVNVAVYTIRIIG